MQAVDAIGSGSVTPVGVGVIVVLIVLAVVAVVTLTKIIAKALVLIVVVVLAIVVWQQRTKVEDKINAQVCQLDTTFFGIQVDAPDSVRQACRGRA